MIFCAQQNLDCLAKMMTIIFKVYIVITRPEHPPPTPPPKWLLPCLSDVKSRTSRKSITFILPLGHQILGRLPDF